MSQSTSGQKRGNSAAQAATINLDYTPREIFIPFHQRRQKRACVICHRRAGKTVSFLRDTIDAALRNKLPRPRYAYIAPLFKQAKAIAWDYLKVFTEPLPGYRTNETELRVDFKNAYGQAARISLYGADNPDAMRGLYQDGVIMDEYGQMNPTLYPQVVGPSLVDRDGWEVFGGTPKGRNQLYEIYKQAQADPDTWYLGFHPASQTGILSPEQLARAKAGMEPEEYEQEFECSFTAALVGAYYARQMAAAEAEGRITTISWDPKLPVMTAWDLGIDDMTAIWFFQIIGREILIIDFEHGSGVGAEWYVKLLQDKPYVYAEHLMPHDVNHYEFGSGKSRADIFRGLGLNIRVVPMAKVEDGVQAVRSLLPRCHFDRARCEYGIEALIHYQREYDDKLETFRSRPRHDWASHPADAFRYLALGIRPNLSGAPAMQQTNYDPLNYGVTSMNQRDFQNADQYDPSSWWGS